MGAFSTKQLRLPVQHLFAYLFMCIKLPPVMTSYANYDVLHSFPLIRNWSIETSAFAGKEVMLSFSVAILSVV